MVKKRNFSTAKKLLTTASMVTAILNYTAAEAAPVVKFISNGNVSVSTSSNTNWFSWDGTNWSNSSVLAPSSGSVLTACNGAPITFDTSGPFYLAIEDGNSNVTISHPTTLHSVYNKSGVANVQLNANLTLGGGGTQDTYDVSDNKYTIPANDFSALTSGSITISGDHSLIGNIVTQTVTTGTLSIAGAHKFTLNNIDLTVTNQITATDGASILGTNISNDQLNATGRLNFTGEHSFTLDSTKFTGNVTTGNNGEGTLILNGANISGDIGAVGTALKALQINTSGAVDNIYVNNTILNGPLTVRGKFVGDNITGKARLTLKGSGLNISGDIGALGSNLQYITVSSNTNITCTNAFVNEIDFDDDYSLTFTGNLTGKVTTGRDGEGTLILNGATVDGTVGAVGTALKELQIGSNNSSVTKAINAGSINFAGDYSFTLQNNFTGNVTTGTDGEGTLILNGATVDGTVGAVGSAINNLSLLGGGVTGDIYAQTVTIGGDVSVTVNNIKNLETLDLSGKLTIDNNLDPLANININAASTLVGTPNPPFVSENEVNTTDLTFGGANSFTLDKIILEVTNQIEATDGASIIGTDITIEEVVATGGLNFTGDHSFTLGTLNFTGNVTTGNNDEGTLILNGAIVYGTVGAAGTSLKELQIGTGDSSVTKAINAKGINFGAAGKLEISDDATIGADGITISATGASLVGTAGVPKNVTLDSGNGALNFTGNHSFTLQNIKLTGNITTDRSRGTLILNGATVTGGVGKDGKDLVEIQIGARDSEVIGNIYSQEVKFNDAGKLTVSGSVSTDSSSNNGAITIDFANKAGELVVNGSNTLNISGIDNVINSYSSLNTMPHRIAHTSTITSTGGTKGTLTLNGESLKNVTINSLDKISIGKGASAIWYDAATDVKVDQISIANASGGLLFSNAKVSHTTAANSSVSFTQDGYLYLKDTNFTGNIGSTAANQGNLILSGSTVTGTVGAGNALKAIYIAEGNSTVTDVINGSVNFIRDNNSLTINAVNGINGNITTTGKASTLTLAANFSTQGTIGSLKEIVLKPNVTFTINHNNAAETISGDSTSSVELSVAASAANIKNVGKKGASINSITANSGGTFVGNLYANNILLTNNTAKTIEFDGSVNGNVVLDGSNHNVVIGDGASINGDINTKTAGGELSFTKSASFNGNLGSGAGFNKVVMAAQDGVVSGAGSINAKNIDHSNGNFALSGNLKVYGSYNLTAAGLNLNSYSMTTDSFVFGAGDSKFRVEMGKGVLGNLVTNNITVDPNAKITIIIEDKDPSVPLSGTKLNVITAAGTTQNMSDIIKYCSDDEKIEILGTNRFENYTFKAIQNGNNGFILQLTSMRQAGEDQVTIGLLPEYLQGPTKELLDAWDSNKIVLGSDLDQLLTLSGNLDPNTSAELLEKVKREGVIHNVALPTNISSVPTNVLGSHIISLVTPIASAAGDENSKEVGLWASAFGGNALQKSYQKQIGFRSSTAGGAIGFDTEINDQTIVGLAGTYSASNVKPKGKLSGDTVKAKSYAISFYGISNLGNNWFAQGSVALGNTSISNNNRRVVGASSYVIAKSKFNIVNYSLDMLAGYNYRVGSSSIITPLAGISYVRYNNDDAQETGAGIQNRKIKMKAVDKINGIMGARISHNIALEEDRVLELELHGFGSYDFKNQTPSTDIRISGYDKSLSSGSQKPSRTSFNLGTSFTNKKGMIEYGAGYDMNLSKKYQAHQGSVKLRVNF